MVFDVIVGVWFVFFLFFSSRKIKLQVIELRGTSLSQFTFSNGWIYTGFIWCVVMRVKSQIRLKCHLNYSLKTD